MQDERVPGLLLLEGEPDGLQSGPMLAQQPLAASGVAQGGELQDDGEVVGQLVVVEREPRPSVEVLALQQRHAALAGVAVREVREVEAAAAAQVERLDVLGLLLPEGTGLDVVEEAPKRAGELGRQG